MVDKDEEIGGGGDRLVAAAAAAAMARLPACGGDGGETREKRGCVGSDLRSRDVSCDVCVRHLNRLG